MVRCGFENIELLDGSFSAVVTIDDDVTRYILNLDYDIELELLRVWNCGDIYYNSDQAFFSPEELCEIRVRYYQEILDEINLFLLTNHEPVFAERPLI